MTRGPLECEPSWESKPLKTRLPFPGRFALDRSGPRPSSDRRQAWNRWHGRGGPGRGHHPRETGGDQGPALPSPATAGFGAARLVMPGRTGARFWPTRDARRLLVVTRTAEPTRRPLPPGIPTCVTPSVDGRPGPPEAGAEGTRLCLQPWYPFVEVLHEADQDHLREAPRR